jgi:hypothetical protein
MGDLWLVLQLGFWIVMTFVTHLQLIVTQRIFIGMSAIGQVAWIATNAMHYIMWNYIHM